MERIPQLYPGCTLADAPRSQVQAYYYAATASSTGVGRVDLLVNLIKTKPVAYACQVNPSQERCLEQGWYTIGGNPIWIVPTLFGLPENPMLATTTMMMMISSCRQWRPTSLVMA
ncbi:hypothetical protein ACA910_008401 [Epithemia clementina (nom. ined.)]